MENENFTSPETTMEKLKTWLWYFGTGIWILIFFGLFGFAVLFYVSYNHIQDIKEKNRISVTVPNETFHGSGTKGKN